MKLVTTLLSAIVFTTGAILGLVVAILFHLAQIQACG
jgi:hypothetical protein